MLDYKELCTFDEIRAYSDPYRMRILREFYNLDRPATSKQIADIIGDVPSKVYYHIKKLEKYHIIKLDHTEEINGIVAKFYEPVAKEYVLNDENISSLPFTSIKSDVENLIHNLYRSSEDIFMIEMRKRVKEKGDEAKIEFDGHTMHGGWLCNNEGVYLTEEEAKQFSDFIESITTKHTKHEDNTKKYHIFISTVEYK